MNDPRFNDMNAFVTAVEHTGQPDTACIALANLAHDILDLKQFTMMASDQQRGVAKRIFSDNPEAWPVGGEKPIPDNTWTEIIFKRRETFVGNSIEELAAVFPDWELIQSVGLESCLNLPVIINDSVVGTLNCLNVAGHFTPQRVAAASQLALPGALVFLLDAQTRQSGTRT